MAVKQAPKQSRPGRARLNVWASDNLVRKVRREWADTGISMQELVNRRLLHSYKVQPDAGELEPSRLT